MLKISFLTIISAALGFLALLSGGQAELHSIEVGWSVSAEKTIVTIDPVFVITTDLRGAYGYCVGDVIFIDRQVKTFGVEDERRVLLHELRHVRQFRALGVFVYPAQLILPIEPIHVNWSDPSVELSEMWFLQRPLPKSWSLLSYEYIRM
ncbi:MAG: hypothetical protein WC565_10430 [Parcubacteria group bacterium]